VRGDAIREPCRTRCDLASARLYEWLGGNAEVRFLPVECVNGHQSSGRNRKMLSVNGALAVDLLGQVAADALEGLPYSGIGGEHRSRSVETVVPSHTDGNDRMWGGSDTLWAGARSTPAGEECDA
jgi:hypothetical protein